MQRLQLVEVILLTLHLLVKAITDLFQLLFQLGDLLFTFLVKSFSQFANLCLKLFDGIFYLVSSHG
ncbi:hypothetical protein D4A39_04510 [Alcanivorax profundi]|uniref:Uncharacterized protein n=1 Tax=Alcanivorax profundi TaxID=2338368 RepID=A0A418Y3H2_9GAMM|nr:hypothetical protein D4A39_04510 [Alcanivorax profundi]